ncbi:MAG: DUF4190 domain-containing protein [Myxococcaceae bacterium]
MHCTYCGSPFAEGTRFCPSCGAQQPAAASQTVSVSPPRPAVIDELPPQQGSPIAPLPPSHPPASNLALVSLVAGITSYFALPVFGAIAAIITGHMAKKEIRESFGTKGGDGLATAGLILGYAHFVLACLIIAAFIAFLGGLAAVMPAP